VFVDGTSYSGYNGDKGIFHPLICIVLINGSYLVCFWGLLLDLQTLGSPPIMPKNLRNHKPFSSVQVVCWQTSYIEEDWITRCGSLARRTLMSSRVGMAISRWNRSHGVTENEVSLAIGVLVCVRYIYTRLKVSLPTWPYLTVCLLVEKPLNHLPRPTVHILIVWVLCFKLFWVSHLNFPSHFCVIVENITRTAPKLRPRGLLTSYFLIPTYICNCLTPKPTCILAIETGFLQEFK